MNSWFTLTPGDHSSKWLRPLPLAISNVLSSTLGAWTSGSKHLPEVKGHLLPELPGSKRPYPVPGIIGKNEIFRSVSILSNVHQGLPSVNYEFIFWELHKNIFLFKILLV